MQKETGLRTARPKYSKSKKGKWYLDEQASEQSAPISHLSVLTTNVLLFKREQADKDTENKTQSTKI